MDRNQSDASLIATNIPVVVIITDFYVNTPGKSPSIETIIDAIAFSLKENVSKLSVYSFTTKNVNMKFQDA